MFLDESCLRVLVENASIGIVVLDENTDIVDANDYMFKIFDSTKKPYMGKKFGNVFGCAYVAENGKVCGSAEECNYCDLRNGVLYVLNQNVDIKDAIVNHSFSINRNIVEKTFKISASPFKQKEKIVF